MTIITPAITDAFIQRGLALVDALLPRDVIDAAAASFAQLYRDHPSRHTGIIEQPTGACIEALYQHPALETAAKSILGADAVDLVHSAALHTLPGEAPWGYDPASEHVDIQFNRDDWLQTPRRIIVTFMVFMDDIPADRAPTVVRPGSHLQIAQHWGSRPAFQDHPVRIADLPNLPYAEPVPIVGRVGQVAISSTAVIHAGSRNASDRARQMLFVYFTPRGLNLRFNVDREHLRVAFLRGLAERFAPERAHLVTHAADDLAASSAKG